MHNVPSELKWMAEQSLGEQKRKKIIRIIKDRKLWSAKVLKGHGT